MKNTDFNTIDDVLEFAIETEQEAHDFYMKLSNNAANNAMKKAFAEFAREEMRHKEFLQKVKIDNSIEITSEKVKDLRIADYIVREQYDSEKMSYEDALVLGMKREKAAYRLYTKLAEKTTNANMQKTFYKLANEEAKHKLKFEIEYDDLVYKEN